MSNRFWLTAFVTLVLGVPVTQCFADDLDGEPTLGRAEPLGSLLFTLVGDEVLEFSVDSPVHIREGRGSFVKEGIIVDVEDNMQRTFAISELGEPRLISVEEIPQLGMAVLLASLTTQELDVLPAGGAVHPDEIQSRLREAAELLAASGLGQESREIQNVISRIDKDHYQRLLLKTKRSRTGCTSARG